MCKNILVTGSNGSIGYHVCNFFRKQGLYVIGLGRKPTSSTQVDCYWQIDLNTNDIFKQLFDTKIDAIVHLAADMRSTPYNIDVVSANCAGTQRLLDFCEKNNIPQFLQLSSLPVIGSPKILPITENHPLCPPTVYHCTKVAAEILADFAMRNKGIKTASFRISSPLGIGINQHAIFNTFVKNAINGSDITIYGKGTRQQNYIHVDDIAQALYAALFAKQCQGVYNLASLNVISNIELAKKCITLLNSKSAIVFNNVPDKADNEVWNVSIKKLIDDINFCPKINIDYSILELAEYYTNEKSFNS